MYSTVSMEVQQQLSQCCDLRYYPCSVGNTVDGFRRQFCNRKALLRLVAIVCVFYLLYLSTGKVPEWFDQGLLELEGETFVNCMEAKSVQSLLIMTTKRGNPREFVMISL